MPKRILTPLMTASLAALIVLTSLWQVAKAASPAYEDRLIQRAEVLFGTGGTMQAGAEPAQTVKCGTPLIYEIRMAWPNLSPETRERLAAMALTDRPELDEFYDFEAAGGRFRIHYTRTGIDSVYESSDVGEGNVPVYVLKCAAYVDTVVTKEIDEMGFRFPVSDSIGKPGEDARYDIYFINLGSRYFGLTYPEAVLDQPGGKYVATSWMQLNSDYTQVIGYENRPFDAMAVTIAHEFNHAIQWSYDALEAEARTVGDELELFPWFFELTATYMEEAVFDRINDYYAYLPSFFDYPWFSLRLFSDVIGPEGLHCYASAVWGVYLAEKYGDGIMVEIWEECETKAGFNTFEAFETVLNRHHSSFEEAWAEFLVWNYFTGRRAPETWGYEEGIFYPEIQDTHIALYETFPVEDSARLAGTPRRPDELGAAYLQFIPGSTDTIADFNIQFSAPEFGEWLVVTAGLRGAVEPDIEFTDDVLFNPITVSNWSQYEEVLVIVSPFKDNPNQDVLDRNIKFSYAVQDSFSGTTEISAVRRVFSNPLNASGGTGESFRVEVALAEPAEVSMYIYSPSGQLIRGGPKDNDSDNQMYWQADRRTVDLWWAGTNRDNQRVASGVYLALVKIGDKSEVIKVAVINK